MLLAINYSPQAATLVRNGQIEIDRFKCPDWPDMIAEASTLRPVSVHFPLTAGDPALATTDWERVAHYMERHDTPYVNLHLAPQSRDFPGIPVDTHDPHQIDLILTRLIADIALVAERFGPERVIIENIPYRGPSDKFLRMAVEPAIIRKVVEATDCGLLLDISHARLSAWALGIDEREYIEQLPVEQIRELHITGIAEVDHRLRDHMPMQANDWPVVEWAIGKIQQGEWGQPWLAAVEYGGIGPAFEWRSDPAVIAADIPRLSSLVKGTREQENKRTESHPEGTRQRTKSC